jgi:two-component system NarL family sensor kinase
MMFFLFYQLIISRILRRRFDIMEIKVCVAGGENMLKDEQRMAELQTLKAISETLNSSNDLYSMLHDVLKELLHVTGLEAGWIFLIDENGQYQLAADYDLPEALCIHEKKPMCEGGCWCLNRYNDGRLNRAANIIECKRLEDAMKENWGDTRGITYHATVPLRAGEEKFGLLNVASPNKTYFTDGELALLETVAYQIGTAVKRIELTRREKDHALLMERNRLARDLHDSVNQLLFSLALTARGTKEMVEDESVKEMLDYIQQLSQEALNEMRALIWQLRPQGLENGISCALIHYGRILGLTVDVQVKGVINLPCRIEEAVWRIGQEALNNCSKHAGVTKVTVLLTAEKRLITLKVQDEGNGFHYDPEHSLLSLGLSTMKERSEMLNGRFSLASETGKGTSIEVVIPL